MEVAPLRSLDDFILSKARFQLPNLNDSNKWPNRVINNLIYYQTNYFLLDCVIFGSVLLYKPKRIITDGVLLPMMLNFLHASFRMRNVRNKLAGVGNVLGVAKQTPMGAIFETLGIEPEYLD